MARSKVTVYEELVILRRALQRAARIIAAEEQLPPYLWQDAEVIERYCLAAERVGRDVVDREAARVLEHSASANH